MTDLPFGLRAYQSGEFEALHAAGSGKLTGSQIPAIMGCSPYAGRYAIGGHILGTVPLPRGEGPMTARGRRMEPLAAEMLAEQGYRGRREPGGMYAVHPTIPNFLASPDALAWHDDLLGSTAAIVEFKVVAEPIFRDKWSDGPPLAHELQHQAQYACCPGAMDGIIAALVVGSFRLELITVPTVRNESAIKLIETAARELLDTLARGEMPPPDGHESAAAVLQALHPVDPGREIVLEGDQLKEAALRFEGWRACSKLRREAEKTEREHKAWFSALAKDASRVMIGNDRRVEIKDVHKKGYFVDPTKYRQLRLISESEE